jgi:hypothetical protein
MNAVKAAQSQAPHDRAVGHADRAELFVGHEPVLTISETLNARFSPNSGGNGALDAHPPIVAPATATNQDTNVTVLRQR